jgi:hypothetical protein
VATPEPVEHSRRLVRAAEAELVRLHGESREVEVAIGRLRRSLDEAQSRRDALLDRIRVLTELAGGSEALAGRAADQSNVVAFPEPATEPPHGYLRGSEIREVAVRVLRSVQPSPRPIHYSGWFELVRDAGYGVAGRDPLATFLTQIGRSPVVVRGEEPGTYVLDDNAPRDLHAELDRLNSELLALHNGQQTIEEIASARERRSELVTRISRVERALEEALQVFADQPE